MLTNGSCENNTLEYRHAYNAKYFQTGMFSVCYIMLGINLNILWLSFNQGLHDQFLASNVGVNIGARNLHKHHIYVETLTFKLENASLPD